MKKKNPQNNIIPFPKKNTDGFYDGVWDDPELLEDLFEECGIDPRELGIIPVDQHKIDLSDMIVGLLRWLTRGRDIQIIREIDDLSASVYLYIGGDDLTVYDIQMFDKALENEDVEFLPNIVGEIHLTIVI